MSARLYPCRRYAAILAATAVEQFSWPASRSGPRPTRSHSDDDDREWRRYGNDPGNMRYQNVDQINRDNISAPVILGASFANIRKQPKGEPQYGMDDTRFRRVLREL